MYFLLSHRYNRTKPEEFDMTATEKEGIYVYSVDDSKWVKKEGIDLGWGREIEFYKLPYLSFAELISIFLLKKYDDDFYGALGELIYNYPKEFQEEFIKIIRKNYISKKDKNLIDLIKLQVVYDDDIIYRSDEKNDISYYQKWRDIIASLE